MQFPHVKQATYRGKNKDKMQIIRGEAFTSVGFRTWNNIKRFDTHIGGVNSTRNKCVKRYEDLMMQNQSIQAALHK